MDYRELLVKCITHVGQQEGTAFLGPRCGPKWLSDDEWAELQKLDKEVTARYDEITKGQ